MSEPTMIAQGQIDASRIMRVYDDGAYVIRTTFGGETVPDWLVGFTFDMDSMRRKSVTGRGVAAMMTAGTSLLAANNRGVVYVTVMGSASGATTFTTRNPSGILLTSIRELQAAADVVIARRTQGAVPVDVSSQLKQLAELRDSGALSEDEFAKAKARLLG